MADLVPREDVLTETITLPVGDSVMPAYLARPRDPESRGAVVVAHELFGVTAHIRDVCERLATTGLTTLAPDFYHRADAVVELPHNADGRRRGFVQLERLQREHVLVDAGAALEYLRAAGSRRIGLLGLSLGGHIAYLTATAHPVDATVAAYPGWLTDTDIALSRPTPTIAETPGIAGQVLILVGAADHAVPDSDLREIDSALTAAAVKHEIVTYPDTPHGFLCDRRDTYRAPAADDAWRRIATLFAETVR
jgi:carboxymethylenebutenolidase